MSIAKFEVRRHCKLLYCWLFIFHCL
jgi:hypothetical protein